MLKPAVVKQPLPRIVEIFNEPQNVPVSEPIHFCLGPLSGTYHLPLSSSTSIHLLGRDFLRKYHARISFSQRGKIILEFDSSHQSNQPGELHDTLTSFICCVSDNTRADSVNTDHLSLLNQLPLSLRAKSPTDVGKIHSTPPIKIQTDPSVFPELTIPYK